MRDFLADLRYALRSTRPGTATLAILLLALGIGANALVFTLIEGILLRPLPFRDPQRLAAIWESTHTWDPKIFACYRDEQVFENESRSFDSLAGWQWAEYTLTGQGDPRRVLGEAVTGRFFQLLGVPAAIGRTFAPVDEAAGPAVVLSHAGWKSLVAAAPDVTGRSLTLDGRPYRILGVMAPGFEFYPRQVQFWVLLTAQDVARQGTAKFHSMGVVGRLRRGVSMTAAESELAALRTALEKSDPDEIEYAGALVRPLQEEFTWLAGRGLRSGLLLLFASVAFVLLIACANVANLLMSRALGRRREIAIRTALGAGRARLIRQILTENLLLFVLGALAGLVVAYAGLRYFTFAQPVELPIGARLSLDWRVLLFGALLGLLTAAISGLLPAIQAARFQIHELLKESGRRASPGVGAQRSRSVLVVFEVALSLTLLAGAALLIDSLVRLRAEPLGYRLEGLLTARLSLPKAAYPALAARLEFCERLLQSLAAVPDLQVTLRSSGLEHAEVSGARERPRQTDFALLNLVDPSYLQVAGVPLLAGRAMTRQDTAQSVPVAIVDQDFARRYFSGHDAIGQHIRLGTGEWRTVVGLAGDIKETNVFDEMHWKVQPHVYIPLWQGDPTAGRQWTLMLRAGPRWLTPDDQPLDTLNFTLHHAVSHLDPNLPLSEVTSMRRFLDEQAFSKPAFRAVLLALFAAVALAMAALGLYGVLAQLVIQRRHEVGVRIALGAAPADVVGLVLRRNLLLTGLGIAIGAAGAALATRVLRGFLLTGPGRPLAFLAAALLMLVVAALAGIVPAWHAAKIDPADALRDE